MPDKIIIKGAKEHNLKNVDLTLPRDKLIVITGLSGSGKSSLAFDTIYAEGQRRYIESLSAYARQFLGQMNKPDVESIEGLSPAIAIEQKTTSKNPRSTVGTVTEIYDYLRLLYARIGIPHCPKCGRVIEKQGSDKIVDQIMEMPYGAKICILSPVIAGRKGEYTKLLENLKRGGFKRVKIDGTMYDLDEIDLKRGAERKPRFDEIFGNMDVRAMEERYDLFLQLKRSGMKSVRIDGAEYRLDEIDLDRTKKVYLELDRHRMHDIDILVDRIAIQKDVDRSRIAQSVETALKESGGTVKIESDEKDSPKMYIFSEKFACPACGICLNEITPRMFSFNSPYGACPTCSGIGIKTEFDINLIIPDNNLSIAEGAIHPLKTILPAGFYMQTLKNLGEHYGFGMDTPIGEINKDVLHVILYGSGSEEMEFTYTSRTTDGFFRTRKSFEGIIPILERRYREVMSDYLRRGIQRYIREKPCPECKGKRLRSESMSVTINDRSIDEVSAMTIQDALDFIGGLKLSEKESIISSSILKEIRNRIRFLIDVGLDYLTVDRSAGTLSGGEAQRIRLATQVGSQLCGVLYILDEPSIGLHQRDTGRLISTLLKLRDLGNTVIVTEHDEQMIRNADFIVDMGPGAGDSGGRIVVAGAPEEVMKNDASLTGKYLSNKLMIPIPEKRRTPKGFLKITKCSEHNLKDIDVKFPLGVMTAITGVSGSGKSTLITETLEKALKDRLYRQAVPSAKYMSIAGWENVTNVLTIDQSPIGRTPRSNPATYTKIFDEIRDLFAQTPESKIRGYSPSRFSFNIKGGRCSVCGGDGSIKIEMQFLPDVYIVCDACGGKRYNRETLEITYKGKNISEVLDMSVDEALRFFMNIPKIRKSLQILQDVGLGYIKLGQNATMLSGGEAQRIKLASELSKKSTGNTFYILDEPTTGLHFADVGCLIKVLQRLVDLGNTVLIIEHNLDVIKSADYIIDLGPEGGKRGGEIVTYGTPEEVAECQESYTGQELKKVLAGVLYSGLHK